MSVSNVSVPIYKELYSKIDPEVKELKKSQDVNSNDNVDLMGKYYKLLSFSRDIETIRSHTYQNKTLDDFNRKLHLTDRDIKNMILDIELQIETCHKQFKSQAKKRHEELEKSINGEPIVEGIPEYEHTNSQNSESIESLKRRLLSTKHDQLDQTQTTEVQNNYHESIQEELINSLPSMVSSIKDQALQFQEMLKQDAVILKEATQNFEASQGRFDNVNSLLSKYHKEGRLGFWFYVRIIGMVLVAFLFLLIIIRLIPARH